MTILRWLMAKKGLKLRLSHRFGPPAPVERPVPPQTLYALTLSKGLV